MRLAGRFTYVGNCGTYGGRALYAGTCCVGDGLRGIVGGDIGDVMSDGPLRDGDGSPEYMCAY